MNACPPKHQAFSKAKHLPHFFPHFLIAWTLLESKEVYPGLIRVIAIIIIFCLALLRAMNSLVIAVCRHICHKRLQEP